MGSVRATPLARSLECDRCMSRKRPRLGASPTALRRRLHRRVVEAEGATAGGYIRI